MISRELVAEAEGAQLDAVGAERVGLDDVGAGAHVLAGAPRATRSGCVRFSASKQRLMKTPLRVEHRPHRAVADEHALVERVEEVGVNVSADRLGRPAMAQPAAAGTSRSVLSQMKSFLL